MLIIPAIDILNDKVVRLTKGDFEQATFYNAAPFDLAKKYNSYGFKWIHLVDLNATLNENISILPLIANIKKETGMYIEFGGGVRNEDQISQLIDNGVDKIIIGSLSITDKKLFEKISATHGPNRFIVAIDSDNETILTKGWTENSGVNIYDHIDYCMNFGIDTFLCTDISRDGTMSGPNYNLYQSIQDKHAEINLIASGGISSIHNILLLNDMDLYAAVIGKAIYENKIKIQDLAQFGS